MADLQLEWDTPGDWGTMTRIWKPLGVAVLLAVLSAWVVGGTLYGIERNNRAGAVEPAAAEPSVGEFSVAPAGLEVAIIGDSYTGGSDMGGRGAAAWYNRTCEALSWVCTANGVGGSGWVAAPTGGTFGARVEWAISQEPDVVVFFGGVNDLGATQSRVRRAATQALMKLRQTLRDVTIVVIGPVAPGDILPAMEQMRDDVLAATRLAGGHFIDPLTGQWFQGSNRRYIGADKIHPTDRGHIYMANLITTAIRKAGLTSIKPSE